MRQMVKDYREDFVNIGKAAVRMTSIISWRERFPQRVLFSRVEE
jgi:hypothetical protein